MRENNALHLSRTERNLDSESIAVKYDFGIYFRQCFELHSSIQAIYKVLICLLAHDFRENIILHNAKNETGEKKYLSNNILFLLI